MKLLAAAAAGTLTLIVLVVAPQSAGPGASGSGVSPALAAAPPGRARGRHRPQCAARHREGRDRPGPGAQRPARRPGAGRHPGGRRRRRAAAGRFDGDHARAEGRSAFGDWVNPQPTNGEHAMGLMQFLPSTWRVESAAAPGSPHDPYRPADAMVAAASYLHRRETAAASEVPHDLRGALAVHGGSLAYADQVLGLATPPAQVAGLPVVFTIPAPG